MFALIALVACGMAAYAATKYEINVGGVEVTSDNCSNIRGEDIISGYAVYSPGTNTLTCYNISISRTGDGEYGIHNRKCDNLTIVFKHTGDNNDDYVYSKDAPALKLERATTIKADISTQSTLHIQAGSSSANAGNTHTIDLGKYDYNFTGDGTIIISNFSPQVKECFHGNGNGHGPNSSGYSGSFVKFTGGQITVKSDNGYAFNATTAYFVEGSDVRILPNNKKQSFNNCFVSAHAGGAILEPFDAYTDMNTVYNSSGTAITSQDIYISSNFVAIFTDPWIPDANFCKALLALYPKGYITSSDVHNITSLDVSDKNISDITGISWFSDLKTLNCSHNNISSVNISQNTNLQTFNCGFNQVSTINYSFPSSLTNLNLYSNNLTSIPALPSGLQYLELGENKFENINIQGHSSLKEAGFSNNRLTGLSVNGCNSLTYLDCSNNQIGAPAMASLINSMRTIPASATMGQFYVRGSDDLTGGGNVITNTQGLNVKQKNWVPYKYYPPRDRWVEMGLNYKGDVNDDSKVNVSDVTALINMILGQTTMQEYDADVNGDGYVNVSDVTALVNIILGQN